MVDFHEISRLVSGKLYECEHKAKTENERARLGTEAVTIALLGILKELQGIHETIKEATNATRP